ncbi:hypothetical protein TNCV_2524321 [Trichonephila clavipes]|nr:hypothetical protein TNCV_2524321 [Trichonephila clavipes]
MEWWKADKYEMKHMAANSAFTASEKSIHSATTPMRAKGYCAYLSLCDLRCWDAYADVSSSGQSDEKSPV